MADIIRVSFLLVGLFTLAVSVKDWWYGDTASAYTGTLIGIIAIGGALITI